MTDIMVIGARGIPDVEGGAEKHAEKMFPLLAERGYSIEIVGIDKFVSTSSYRGVSTTGLPTVRFMKSDKLVYNFLALAYALMKRPKLVHLQGTNSGLFLSLYKLFGLKVVLRYGSSDTQFDKWSTFERKIIRFCEYQLRFADRVIAVSQQFKADLETNKSVRHVDVVPNAIDTAEVSPEAKEFWSSLNLKKNQYVLSVGRLTVDKDFETLVEAVNSLSDKNIKLVVAGGSAEPGYSERLYALGCDRILFIGRIDRSLLSALYANCAVYVNCSRHEGLSNALLEAISYQRPLAVSKIPANLEMKLKPESYFDTGNAQALAKVLCAAIDEPDRFVAPTENFCDWQAVSLRTEDIYRQILPAVFAAPMVTSSDARVSE